MAKKEIANTETKEIANLDDNLKLVITEQKLGLLITNAKEIQEFVKNKLTEYSADNYSANDSAIDKDKAELNTAAKNLNSERLRLEKEFMAPFEEFKNIMNVTCNMIKEASSKLDEIIKKREQDRKNEKKKEIQEYWDSLNFSLVTLEKIFNPKWLNKGPKMKDIKAEIDEKLTNINEDLKVLTDYAEDAETLKSLYLYSLDLQSTLKKAAELKANRERLAAAEKKAEAPKSAMDVMKQGYENHLDHVDIKTLNKPVITSNPSESPVIVAPSKNPKVITFYILEEISRLAEKCNVMPSPMKLVGTAADVKLFKDKLLENGYSYEKSMHHQDLILDITRKGE